MSENLPQKKKVLIIEDDKFFANLLALSCKDEELEFEIAIGGEKGIACAKEIKPNLIVLDILMPGMDGFQVLAILKEDPSLASIPVIILSNLGQEDEMKKGLSLGAVDYIIKASHNLHEIVGKIKEYSTK